MYHMSVVMRPAFEVCDPVTCLLSHTETTGTFLLHHLGRAQHRLHKYAGSVASLLFTNCKNRLFHDKALNI